MLQGPRHRRRQALREPRLRFPHGPEQEFCNTLQAKGKTVVLADHVGLSSEPGSMTVPIFGYDTQKDLWVTTRTPGVVAYRCPDAADGGS